MKQDPGWNQTSGAGSAGGGVSRRGFLKAIAVGGVTVWIAPLYSAAFGALFEERILRGPQWNPADGRTRFRMDGHEKVVGGKVFARDIRAADMPHWPKQQSHALILRTTLADRLYEGFDLAALGDDLKPDRVVTAEDLARDKLAFPSFYGEDMLLPTGKTPAYLGHAVAILIFHDFARYQLARGRLRATRDVIRYGATTGPLDREPWGVFRYVRVGGASPDDEDAYSSLKDSPLFPTEKKTLVWPSTKPEDSLDARGMRAAGQIGAELAAPPGDWLVMKRRYTTQSIDTAALEPDNANCWYDPATRSLHMVLATQSPQEVAEAAAQMVADSGFPLEHLFVHPCYTVGYGSKDHCNVPFYGLVAALYGDGHPVRFAVDRFEHFQTSLKRHAFDMQYTMAVDRKTGKLQSFQGTFTGNGGGRSNFSPSVVMVAATAAQSVYYFPKNDLIAVAEATRAVDAGSARGYGTLQSMAATEMMIDEMAAELDIDPIEFRVRNALLSGMKNTQGAIAGGALRVDEVLERARRHPLWTGRVQRKLDYEAAHPNERYGVGFACVQKDFGTGGEAAFVRVALTPEGRIVLHHTGVEIGTGMSTSQAVMCAEWFGRPADEVRTAVTDWSDLPMVGNVDTYTVKQEEQDRLAADPLWTPVHASPSSASNSVYFFGHATKETARVVFEHGLWPAAMAIWTRGIGGGQAAPLVVRREDARWTERGLTANGLEPLPLERLVKTAYEANLVTAAVGHTFNRWQWAEADFNVGGTTVRRPLDGLAVRHGDGSRSAQPYDVIKRSNVFYPPTQRNNAGVTYYSANAALAELAVNPTSGQVRLLSHHSIMECGKPVVEELVSGQLQGGIAMGIGHALHEYLPLYEDGPGNGTWNFDRYHLPRAHDVAVWSQTGDILPPISDTDPPKGIAEVVMIPIVAAIVNGIAHAIGHRFTDLPVTPEKIREVLEP